MTVRARMNEATMRPADLAPKAKRAATLLKAMANEKRLLILCHLAQGERSVGELGALVGLSQSALSQHLARLREDHLVATRHQAQTRYYRLVGPEAESLMRTLYDIYCARPAKAGGAS